MMGMGINHRVSLAGRLPATLVQAGVRGAPGVALFALAMLSANTALADLGGRPGQTALQSGTGTAVQTACGFFARGETIVQNAQQQDLFDRCREMVQTANDLDGLSQNTRDSLGLSESDLAAGLQQLATEEAATASSMATETSFGQMNTIGLRLAAVRGGAAGFAVSGLGGTSGQLAGRHRRGGAAGDPPNGNGRLGGFLNGTIGTGEKDATDRENAFEYDVRGITAGLDYRFADDLVAGVAVAYSSFDSDFDRSATVAGGDVESDGYTVSLYGTYYLERLYIDGIASYGDNSIDMRRRIVYTSNTSRPSQNRTAVSDTDSNQLLVSIGGGYDTQRDALTFGPHARLTYLDVDVDGYQERGAMGLNLEVDAQEVESLQSTLGVHVSSSISRPGGVLVPQARLEWHHEFDDDVRTIVARYLHDPNRVQLAASTDEPDRDYFTLGLSLSGVFRGGTQGFVDYETVLGLDDITDHVITAGVRAEF